jgi:predicted enzyme related to lactoylglutathione lyase
MEVQVNIDCADADALRDFYCQALGYVAKGGGAQYRSCVPGEGATGPKLIFQQVPESKRVKNRMHLDLIVGDDIEGEAARFVALGATRVSAEPFREQGCAWIVMNDPEGNEICICDS